MGSFHLVELCKARIQSVVPSLSCSAEANVDWLCWCFDAYASWMQVEDLQKLPVKCDCNVDKGWGGGGGIAP